MEAALCEEETEHELFSSSRSSDLLRGFCGGFSGDDLAEEDSDEIDLGLSLGGCFSSADSRRKTIPRCSSIPSILPSGLQPAIPLSRASSLPSETGEGIWRRKEMQSIGKRKRDGGERIWGDLEGGSTAKVQKIEVPNGGSRDFSPAISSWITGAKPPKMSEKFVRPASQGSNGSPGQGFRDGSEIRRTMAEHKNHETPSSLSATPMSRRVKSTGVSAVGGGHGHPLRKNDGDSSRMLTEEMPLVSTRGDGRNGRRIQGFLYKCGRGEVSIVCVCHGSFLTPAEFVKHGGGGDVAHPLKHIIVDPSSPFL